MSEGISKEERVDEVKRLLKDLEEHLRALKVLGDFKEGAIGPDVLSPVFEHLPELAAVAAYESPPEEIQKPDSLWEDLETSWCCFDVSNTPEPVHILATTESGESIVATSKGDRVLVERDQLHPNFVEALRFCNERLASCVMSSYDTLRTEARNLSQSFHNVAYSFEVIKRYWRLIDHNHEYEDNNE